MQSEPKVDNELVSASCMVELMTAFNAAWDVLSRLHTIVQLSCIFLTARNARHLRSTKRSRRRKIAIVILSLKHVTCVHQATTKFVNTI